MDEKENPTNVPETEYSDPDLLRKHSLMLERLSNRHQNRLDNSHRSESESSSFESTSSFLSRFSEMKRSIESQLADYQTAPSDPSELKFYFEKISASISDLEKLMAENSYFLPSYDVRSSLKTISDLKQSLESLNSQLIPKRKFSFKNKANKKESGVQELKEPLVLKHTDASLEKTSPEKTRLAVQDSPGFRSIVGQVLFKEFRGSEVGEFTISDLDSCEVRLIGCLRVLFVHRLKNCQVYVGPVMGSIHIEEVEGCIFVMASHQIRIHDAKRSDFYLRVRSRPIIEDSNSVRFSPYCLTYEGIEEDLQHANLDNENGNWANVDDFKWLRATQSPNWSLLPENQRIKIVYISTQEVKNDNT